MLFNEILLQERKRRGLSQEELAARLNVSRQAVSRWETGDAMPDLPKLLVLADVLDISLDELCGREGSSAAAATKHSISPQKPAKKHKLLLFFSCVAVIFLLSLGALMILSLSAPSAPSPSPVAAAKEFTVAGLNFYGESTTKVHYQFTPSISAEGVSYQIIFVTPRGKTFPVDAPCVSGVCAGEATLDKAYSGYSVSVSVTDSQITRSIPVANNLTFSQGNASWTPINP